MWVMGAKGRRNFVFNSKQRWLESFKLGPNKIGKILRRRWSEDIVNR